ncbi:helix-turn-helix domain-containing protein [Pseudovibrio ascidiaceicola]|uniref:helix-turn-helix domain-containing protein n=1 Tax=Pseudovibrio ascidiaceicola TaxID=285279 RepID=UPI003D363F22
MPKRSVKAPEPVDVYVGSRVRMRRMLSGISQEKLGEAIGITFQQVQKYEKGTNRIGASRLAAIAASLKCRPDFFFEGAPGVCSSDEADQSKEILLLSLPGAVDLLQAFASSSSQGQRSLINIAQQVAA